MYELVCKWKPFPLRNDDLSIVFFYLEMWSSCKQSCRLPQSAQKLLNTTGFSPQYVMEDNYKEREAGKDHKSIDGGRK